MIKCVLSGFQSGADFGGILAANKCGVKTGGWMPRGFRTEDGLKPEYETLYNARETRSESYYPRTEQNIKESDGTLIIAGNFDSAGTKATKNLCQKHEKPYFLLPFLSKIEPTDQIIKWIKEKRICILNVAGNRESVCTGISTYTYQVLMVVFEKLQNENTEKVNFTQKTQNT